MHQGLGTSSPVTPTSSLYGFSVRLPSGSWVEGRAAPHLTHPLPRLPPSVLLGDGKSRALGCTGQLRPQHSAVAETGMGGGKEAGHQPGSKPREGEDMATTPAEGVWGGG